MAAAPEPADHVVDASAIAKLFLDEPESEAFRSWYLTEIEAGSLFAAPGLLEYEVAHLLARNLKPPAGTDRTAWLAERHDEVLAGIVLDHRAARGSFRWTPAITGYDASYLAAAMAHGASLVTYDDLLLRQARKEGIRTHTPR